MNNKKCAIIGSTPEELSYGYDEEYPTCVALKTKLAERQLELIQEGCVEYISSLEQGAEMWGAEACAAIKALGGQVKLTCVPTSESQADRWHPERRERYFRLLEECSEVINPVHDGSDACGSADDYIISHADLLLVVGDRLGERASRIVEQAKARGAGIIRVS